MKKLFEDYKVMFSKSQSKWGKEMLKLFEDRTYNIDIKNPIELPIPMQDGKLQLEPGNYEVELASDKKNYIWTNPETQERVVFPVDLINQPTENPDQQAGQEPTGTEPGPTEPGAAPPPEGQEAGGEIPADLLQGLA